MRGVTHTRLSVLERARAGDAGEFAHLYAPLAFAMARKVGLEQNDAEDVMQQTMLELLRLLQTFQYDRQRGSFKGLIKKIVRARAYDHLRKRRATAGDEALDGTRAEDPFEKSFEREWQKALLVAALDRVRTEVKPTTFQSFQLTELSGWPVQRTAEMLGLTANQVSQNRHRVFERIQRHVQELSNDSV